jgi:hypothetical protein
MLSNDEPASPDLLISPHIVPQLIDLIAGQSHAGNDLQEQLVSHLTECEACRTALIILLDVAREADRRSNLPERAASDVLARFVTIHQRLAAQEYERMGAYAEAIVARGKEEAGRRFPVLATHVEECPNCRMALEATLTFLAEEEIL